MFDLKSMWKIFNTEIKEFFNALFKSGLKNQHF